MSCYEGSRSFPIDIIFVARVDFLNAIEIVADILSQFQRARGVVV